jgi:hypothetical protein
MSIGVSDEQRPFGPVVDGYTRAAKPGLELIQIFDGEREHVSGARALAEAAQLGLEHQHDVSSTEPDGAGWTALFVPLQGLES